MIGKMVRLVEVGQYIKLRGHKVRDFHYFQWWKVADVEGTTVHLIDRHGRTSRINTDQCERLRWKAMIWEPGDDRRDEAAADLPR